MTQVVTTMTQRGQVTVPAEVRRLLDLHPGDKVVFEITDGDVRIAPASFTLETAFGSVKRRTRTTDYKRISRDARDEKAEREVRKLRDQ